MAARIVPVLTHSLLSHGWANQAAQVFAGGGTLAAIEAVCGAGAPAAGVPDGLDALVGQGLLRVASGSDGEPRFALLETVREYALERPAARGEAAAVACRHAAHYLALAEAAEIHLAGPQQLDWLAHLDREDHNLRTALTWALDGGEPVPALRLAGALWSFWQARGRLDEGRRWLERALAVADDAPPDLRARALVGAGALARSQGAYAEARARLEAGRALHRELGDAPGVARALYHLAIVARYQGDAPGARALHEEGLALQRAAGDHHGTAGSLVRLGTLAQERGERGAARRRYEAGLATFRAVGDTTGIAAALTLLGALARERGDRAAAASLTEESLALHRVLGNARGIASALVNLGLLADDRGDPAAARARYEAGLRLFREAGDGLGVVACL